jgi:hypothetical protein
MLQTTERIMGWNIFRRAFGVVLAFTSFVVASPGAAAPISLRALAAQTVRVETIAYRISTATALNCADPEMVTGLVLHDLSGYDPSVRPSVSRAFSLRLGIGVIQIVPGSAADRAGLRIDDEILAVNDLSVQDYSAVNQPRKSYRRVDGFTKVLQAALARGPAELLLRRDGALVRMQLRGELGCGGEASLLSSHEQNAWSDGKHVVVTTAMMDLARSDDELAFVIAHEMAHNILGHSRYSRQGIFGLGSASRRQELAADYVAVWLMTEGGYKAEGGVDFLRVVQRHFWWNFSFDHPSFSSRIKTVAAAEVVAATSPSWGRAHANGPPQPSLRADFSRTIAAIDSAELQAQVHQRHIAGADVAPDRPEISIS